MARKGCFKVSTLKFTFYCTNDKEGKFKIVSEGIRKYMKKYNSDIAYNLSHRLEFVEEPDVLVEVKFSTGISINDVNDLLSEILNDKLYQIVYTRASGEMRVSVVG